MQRGSIELFMCTLVFRAHWITYYQNIETEILTALPKLEQIFEQNFPYLTFMLIVQCVQLQRILKISIDSKALQYYQIEMPAYVLDTFDNELFSEKMK